MLGRRQIDATANSHAPLRSSLADAAFAVEERLVWGGRDALSRLFELVKWPFERAAWAIEKGLLWPLEERTGGSARALGAVALALVALGAAALGLTLSSGGGGSGHSTVQQAAAPAPPPAVRTAPAEEAAKAAPVLHGATPKLVPESAEATAKATDGGAAKGSAEAAGDPGEAPAPTSSSAGEAAVPAGPGAIKVAHQFADAFVLYEIGQTDSGVRQAFAETASPQLMHALLRRPPRLPADAKVPQAEVLNIVPGPQDDDTYTLSVSLLRLGVTSELRITMARDEKTGEWQVTDALG